MKTRNFFLVAGLAALSLSSLQLARAQDAKDEDDDDVEVPTPHPAHARKAKAGAPARTEEAPKIDAASLAEARELLVRYLDAVKKKDWKAARALTDPKTLAAIAQVKKRLGEERHSMAPWFWAKGDFYLTNYKITKVNPAMRGTVVVETSEDSFQMQEKGEYAGETAAYLLGRLGGRWYVVDKKSEADGFTPDAIRYGYPGYFDGK